MIEIVKSNDAMNFSVILFTYLYGGSVSVLIDYKIMR